MHKGRANMAILPKDRLSKRPVMRSPAAFFCAIAKLRAGQGARLA
jgi:hypothetical protein